MAFAREVLGVDLWSRQQDIARALRDHPRVAVRSCHAAGKTLVAAVCVCWFLYTRRDAIVLTTASTFRQVRYVLWRTIQGLVSGAPRHLGGDLLDTELRLGERWYGLGLSTNHPERFQGFHAPHVLVVVDEPGAVPHDVFAAIEGVLASGHTRLLMIGNPTQPAGPFFDAFHAQAGAYRTFRISAFDTPNFQTPTDQTPNDETESAPPRDYLVSPAWVQTRRDLWGAGSDLYRARVLGEFPRQAADGLFSLAILDAATAPGPAPALTPPDAPLHPSILSPSQGDGPDPSAPADPAAPDTTAPDTTAPDTPDSETTGPATSGHSDSNTPAPPPVPPLQPVSDGDRVGGRGRTPPDPDPYATADPPTPPRAALGVDIARFGDDATAFTWIEDGRLVRQQEFHGLSLMETAGRVIEALDARPDLAVALDDTGLGGGVTDRLREQGLDPLAINFGAAANDRDHYANRAAELYSRLARALEQNDLLFPADLPNLDALVGQLTGVLYSLGSDGRRRVHKRGPGSPQRDSPDLADSLALAWAAYEEGSAGPGIF